MEQAQGRGEERSLTERTDEVSHLNGICSERSVATVAAVGVGAGIDGTGGRGALSPSASLQDARHQEDDGQHEEQGGDGDADRELPHRDAELLCRPDPLCLLTCET